MKLETCLAIGKHVAYNLEECYDNVDLHANEYI